MVIKKKGELKRKLNLKSNIYTRFSDTQRFGSEAVMKLALALLSAGIWD